MSAEMDSMIRAIGESEARVMRRLDHLEDVLNQLIVMHQDNKDNQNGQEPYRAGTSPAGH